MSLLKDLAQIVVEESIGSIFRASYRSKGSIRDTKATNVHTGPDGKTYGTISVDGLIKNDGTCDKRNSTVYGPTERQIRAKRK